MSAIATILTRPLRAATWRELAYLLLGGVMAVVAFTVVVTGISTVASLLITLIGIPLFVGFAYVNRGLAWLERRRTSFLLGESVAGVYKPPARRGFVPLLKAVVTDSQTWKDLAWLIVVSMVGFAFAVTAVTLWATALYLLSYPLWWWIVPDAALPELGGDDRRPDTWGWAALAGAAGIVGILLTTWICAGLARVQALLARLLLAPSERQRLVGRVDELSRTRAVAADAQAAELQRIERDLHDGAQARLVAVSMDLGRAQEKLEDDPEGARRLVESAHEEARNAIVELRQLVAGIYPAVLADRGLDAALSSVAATSRVPVSLDVDLPARVPPAAEVAAYFVVAESIANVNKHSGAARADVRVRANGDELVVEVSDDGHGGADASTGTGLAGLAARLEALDGRLRVASPAGGPTVVRAEIPCAS
jgi:signal transduction histidine kinase